MPVKEPVSVDFGVDANTVLSDYVWNNITNLKDSQDKLHTEKVKKWRRLYRGIPRDEHRSFPWKDASNVIIQLIGENVDIIRAGCLGTIFEVMPLFATGILGEWPKDLNAGALQEITHEFLNYVGLEPQELDLYRVESIGISEQIKFGTVAYKLPWTTDTESEVIGMSEGKMVVEEFTKYDGPRPEKIEFEKWAATPTAATLETADFKYHIVTLTKQKLEERKHKGFYKFDKDEDWDQFLTQPDRYGPSDQEQEKLTEKGMNPPSAYDNAEWDVHECWFPYFHNGVKYRLIYSYHYNTKRTLRKIFNFYAKNEEPWELSRFGYTDDGLHGYGLCEMLEHYQEEVSTGHNQRVDNRTLANTSILRVDPNSKLDAIFSIYPNALVPAAQDEIEKIQLGANYPTSVPEEQLTLGLAKSRAGTEGVGQEGGGGGVQNAKRGIYSAMGTFSVMQAGNRRINVNIMDARYTHLKMGRKFLNQYSNFGIGERLKYFGQKSDLLRQALLLVASNNLVIPIRSATASINKELEKQNDLLLTQVMQRHHMGISQILQAVANPAMQQMPKFVIEFLVGWVESSSIIMSRILRNFGHDDLSRLLPEKKLLEGASNARSRTGSSGGVSTPAIPEQSVEQTNTPQGGPNGGMASQAGGGGFSAVPI